VIGIVISIIALVISVLIARYYGDVAGTNAAIKYEEEKSRNAFINTISSIKQKFESITYTAHYNSQVEATHGGLHVFVKMPIEVIENAFYSPGSVLGEIMKGNDEFQDALGQYFMGAYSINSLIDLYNSVVASTITSLENVRERDIQLGNIAQIIKGKSSETEGFANNVCVNLLNSS
jgi:hypothetical protein